MSAPDPRPDTALTLVVCLDGSEHADTALRPAAAFAARAGGRLLLVACASDEGAQLEGHLAARAARFRGVVDVDVSVITTSAPADALLEAAGELGALLCLSTHGHGGVRTALLGSVAHEVVCRTTRPVLLVGPRCRTAPLVGEAGDLVATSDGSSFSHAVLPAAEAWADATALTPWVVEVVGPDELVSEWYEPPRNREVEAAERRLAALAGRLRCPEGGAARTQVLHGADAARSITAFAERLPAATIAMATHGRSGLARIVMGSVAADVVRTAPCPVLLVRPTDHGTDDGPS